MTAHPAAAPGVLVTVAMALTGCNVVQSFEAPELTDASVNDASHDTAGRPDAANDQRSNAETPCESCLSFSARIASSDGDAEECPDGEVAYEDTSLQLTRDDSGACAGEQTVGLFFETVEVPVGATIREATIQFTAAASGSEPTDLVIWGEDGVNPPDFDDRDSNVSNRPRLAQNVSWAAVAAWEEPGDAGPAQRTPDLSSVVQELVDQPGWASGNAMTFIVEGTGQRVAVAFDAEPAQAAELTIRYAPP